MTKDVIIDREYLANVQANNQTTLLLQQREDIRAQTAQSDKLSRRAITIAILALVITVVGLVATLLLGSETSKSNKDVMKQQLIQLQSISDSLRRP